MRRTPRSTLFPYTTLFRSRGRRLLPNDGLSRRYLQLRPRPRASALHVTRRRRVTCSADARGRGDRKSTRLNSSHMSISYAVFCLKKKKKKKKTASYDVTSN